MKSEFQPVFDEPLGSFYRDEQVQQVGSLRMTIWYEGVEYCCTWPVRLVYFLESWEPYSTRLPELSLHIETLSGGGFGLVLRGGPAGDTLLWYYRHLPEWLQAQL
jgi:hypothetical protein